MSSSTQIQWPLMKMITFLSLKGGAGKTTALMAAASSLAADGHKLALFEADINAPLIGWEHNAKANGLWPDTCIRLPAESWDAFETSYATAETAGCDFALVDTAGGGSDLNTGILVNSDIIIVPCALAHLDIETALSTMEYVITTLKADGTLRHFVLLFNRVPTQLAASHTEMMAELAELPTFQTQLKQRNAYEVLPKVGPLHAYLASLEATGQATDRLRARHYRSAVLEADALAKDILDVLAMEGPKHAIATSA